MNFLKMFFNLHFFLKVDAIFNEHFVFCKRNVGSLGKCQNRYFSTSKHELHVQVIVRWILKNNIS